ncbi:MAG: hypothetical protein IJP90_06495 [Treponema sp.]|nr:hypothetical protein [Treponema sp.]
MDDEINKPLCFVIIGYGEKNDYPRNRKINLDKTYENIIEPSAIAAGYKCIRCKEIKHSGLIDVPMYRTIFEAELVIADISTLNANALYELGIRHGVRAFSTIILAQEDEDVPFDIEHVSIFRYKHLGEDIGCSEAIRCQKALTELINEVKTKQEVDSPFYTYMRIKSLNESQIVKNTQVQSYNSFDSKEVACLSLIGRWDDREPNDREIIKRTIGINNSAFLDFVSYSKEINSPLSLNNFQWQLSRTNNVLELFCKYNNSELLSNFKETAIEVLSEFDPKFELEKDKRFMASVIGKNCKYSKNLRFGISETLVWLSINKEKLLGEQNQFLVDNVVYQVLNNSNWRLWASLNELLPTLAEASPDSFLKTLQEQITKHSEVIVELFKQEGDGILSGSLMTGILWSLETIAWIPNNFQMVTVVLAELSRLDIGGNYTNRPINSLKTILLPWINNTTATTDAKMKAVKYLFDNYSDIAWKIIFSLLPSMNSTSFGCSEPKYRKSLLDNFKRDVSRSDYVTQITEYSNYAIELMKKDFNRIFVVLENLNAINPESYSSLFKYLENYDFERITDEDKFTLWEKLNDLIKKHKRFANSKWAYKEDIIGNIEKFAKKIQPTDKRLLYRALFTLPDYELSDEVYDEHKTTNWEAVRKNATEKRETAFNEILNEYGLETIPEFIVNERMAISVATILGNKKNKEIDSFLIPKYLNSENEYMNLLCSSYIRGSSYIREKDWFSHLKINSYENKLKTQFLINLKFESSTWDLAREILGEDYSLYWENVNQNVLACESDLTIAIKEFNKVHRFDEATECIHSSIFNKHYIEPELIIETLSNVLRNSPSEKTETYKLIEIIKYLETSTTDKESLWKIEWGFYGLFIFDNKNVPNTLYQKLATAPALYVTFLKLGFKEDNDKRKKELSEKEQALAQCSWNLLNNFHLLPGLDKNGLLNSSVLLDWIKEVLKLAQEVNRITSAKLFIGHLLYHSPADKDGFWIDRSVANILNDFKNGDMLRGYKIEDINSRGAHVVDTTGAQENAIGDLWRKRAEELRNENYPFFASEADSIAKFYYDSAKQSQNMAIPPERELI